MMARVFMISDLHLGHKNVLKFRHCRYDSLDEMHQDAITSWNSVVTKRDLVYVLGDIAWGSAALQLYKEMNGNKTLIMGNHDKFKPSELLSIFGSIHGARAYKGHILTHIPIHPSEFRRWRYNIHGHLHGNKIKDPRYINVNVDTLKSFFPVPFDQLIREHERRIAY